jgi:hypothetical protein
MRGILGDNAAVVDPLPRPRHPPPGCTPDRHYGDGNQQRSQAEVEHGGPANRPVRKKTTTVATKPTHTLPKTTPKLAPNPAQIAHTASICVPMSLMPVMFCLTQDVNAHVAQKHVSANISRFNENCPMPAILPATYGKAAWKRRIGHIDLLQVWVPG